MILKAKHLYKLDFVKKELYKDFKGYRGYCIICPCKDIEYNCELNKLINSFIHIDVFGKFNTDSSIYFGDGWNAIKPSISDVFEILQHMKGGKYKYNFKTNEITNK